MFSLFLKHKISSLMKKAKDLEFETKILESRSLLENAAQSTIDTALEVTSELKNRIKDYTNQIQVTSDLLDNAMITINSEGKIKTFNKSAHNMFKTHGNDMIGFDISILFRQHEGDIVLFEDLFKSLNCGQAMGCFQSYKIKGRRFDGELFWIEVRCNEYFDSAGNTHYVILLYDIDEKIKLENTCLANQWFNMSYQDSLSFDILFIHNFSSILDVSTDFFDTLGYNKKDLNQLNPYKLIDRNYWGEINEAKGHRNFKEYKAEIIHKNGILLPVMVKSTPVVWRGDLARMATIKFL